MNDGENEAMVRALKEASRPLQESKLEHDLWPRMLVKLDERHARVSRLDWALAGLLVLLALVFPQAIPALLYHL